MMKATVLVVTMVCMFFAANAQRIEAGGNALWAEDGVAICTALNNQSSHQLVSDGYGGAISVWRDNRSGTNYDIYAQRIDANGDTLWPADGVIVGTDGLAPQICSESFGGAIITWQGSWGIDWDILAQRVGANGDTLWRANGVAICTYEQDQEEPQITEDGVGGAIITWSDPGGSIYAQRVNADGDTLWHIDGVDVCYLCGAATPQIVTDDLGGAIIAWRDWHLPAEYDIYAQRVDSSGYTLWLEDGVPICTATDDQNNHQLIADGVGGAIIIWEDYRGDGDIYAQRVDADGNVMWLADGEPICTAVGEQKAPQLTSDGSEGAIIVWEDDRGAATDIYAQRIDANGHVVWTVDGVAVCAVDENQTSPRLVGDGIGGVMIVWADFRSGGNWDIYAQRVDAFGDTLMPAGGGPICTEANDQTSPQIVSDDSGGAIIAWRDNRTGNYDIYAQRITGPTPQITSINDVPQDQGRQVAVIWDRSYLDAPQYQVISEYSIWRKYPEGIKVLGRQWDGTRPKDFVQPVYRLVEERDRSGRVRTKAWEYIGAVDAHYLESYAYIAPTLWDSSATDPAYFSFFVSAHTIDPFVFYDSRPDSGYSVDDISPGKTQVSVLASGSAKGSVNTVWLSWDQVTIGVDGSPEKGPIDYRIYCDESPDFMPTPGNLVATTSDLFYPHTDSRIGDPAANLFYLVTATDGSGNESAASNVVGEFDRRLSSVK